MLFLQKPIAIIKTPQINNIFLKIKHLILIEAITRYFVSGDWLSSPEAIKKLRLAIEISFRLGPFFILKSPLISEFHRID